MLVGVEKIAGITAPESVLSGFDDGRPGLVCLVEQRIDFAARGDVVGERKLGRAARPWREPGVEREILARKQRELDAVLKIEESDGAVCKFGADDAFALQPQAVTIKTQRSSRSSTPSVIALRRARIASL